MNWIVLGGLTICVAMFMVFTVMVVMHAAGG